MRSRKRNLCTLKRFLFGLIWNNGKGSIRFALTTIQSTYEIMQYVLGCFLRVADPMPGDDEEEVLPDEIKEMFYDLSQAERHFEYVKPKRKLPQHKVDEMNGQKRLEGF